MADFTAAVEMVLRHEGGYAHDPRDAGGETNWGISRRSYPHLNIQKLTKEDARAIYRQDFWRPLRLDEITSELLAGQILDFGINAGLRVAVVTAQKAINYFHPGRLEEDGLMSPKTLAELNACRQRGLLVQIYQALRVAHYVGLVRAKPAFAPFAGGWARRVFEAT